MQGIREALPACLQLAYLLRQLEIASPRENLHMVAVVAYHGLILSTMVGRHPTLYSRYR